LIQSRITKATAALCFSVALIGGLSACGDDKKDDSKAATTSAAAMTTGDKTDAPSGSKSSVTVDGKAWTGTFTTVCAKQGDLLALTIGDPAGDATKGASATVKADDTVTAVGIGNVASGGLGYAEGAPGGSATLKKDGKTYTVTGEATGVDLANPLEPKKSTYEIVFACETIVGG
jgi:ipoprotein LpqH